VRPRGGAGQCGGQQAHPGSESTTRGEKAVAHRCSEVAAGSGSLRGGGSGTLQR
jgi:hypothetical protein